MRLFIAFRVFFNARFYYPVFTILFLDFGLTLQQFALLNVAWAAAIVLLEVPSGALADVMGRRNLLIAASILMVVEIALLCFVPMGYPNLLFAVFLMNRVLSGTAEAAASGADEALAYDSLKREGNIDDWANRFYWGSVTFGTLAGASYIYSLIDGITSVPPTYRLLLSKADFGVQPREDGVAVVFQYDID